MITFVTKNEYKKKAVLTRKDLNKEEHKALDLRRNFHLSSFKFIIYNT